MSPAGICGERRSSRAWPRWARTWNRRAVVQLPSRLVTAWLAGIRTGAAGVACVRFITSSFLGAGSGGCVQPRVSMTDYSMSTILFELPGAHRIAEARRVKGRGGGAEEEGDGEQ